jgi:pantothenate synthetase
VATEPLVALDYAAVVRADTLAEVTTVTDPASLRLLIAAQVGPVRLIDNSAALAATEDVPAAPVVTGAARQLERIG